MAAALAVPAAFVLSPHGADRVGFSVPTYRPYPPSGIVLRLGFSPMWQGRMWHAAASVLLPLAERG
eukprot:14874082-Alexandrium_andersonii.AAC.1